MPWVQSDLGQLSLSQAGAYLQICIPQAWQPDAQQLRISADGRIFSQENLIETVAMGQQLLTVGGNQQLIENGRADFGLGLLLESEVQVIPATLRRLNSAWEVAVSGGTQSSKGEFTPLDDPEKSNPPLDPDWIFNCGATTKFTCYNGNCGDVCTDLANEEACGPTEAEALTAYLAELDSDMANVDTNNLSFPARFLEVQFCGGITRLVLEEELEDATVAYRYLSARYVPDTSVSLFILDNGVSSTGTVVDLLSVRPGNSDLSFQLLNLPPPDPNPNPIDPVTGEDPNQPVTDVTTPVSYYLYDHLGNTRMLFRADAPTAMTITYAADYYPYGKILREFNACGPVRFLTTQHERDAETGYDNRGARLYDAEVGRFLSVDPLAEEFGAYSSYSYVLGNPVRLVDPNGEAPSAPEDIIVTDSKGNYLFLLEDGKSGYTIETAKSIYDKGIQWFEPEADNYMAHLGNYPGLGQSEGILHFTSEDISNFASESRPAWEYQNGWSGDWKDSEDGANGYFLVTLDANPIWADAIGQIPFAADMVGRWQSIYNSGLGLLVSMLGLKPRTLVRSFSRVSL
ncbi:MAG: RHS repeat-associated core domain-containing protein [Bacteroidota bacterium]